MCESNTYKGFIIYHNKQGNKFDCPYLSIVNQRINKSDGHKVHVHIQASEKTAKLIIDCGLEIQVLFGERSINDYNNTMRNRR